jgi:hypothetical protein
MHWYHRPAMPSTAPVKKKGKMLVGASVGKKQTYKVLDNKTVNGHLVRRLLSQRDMHQFETRPTQMSSSLLLRIKEDSDDNEPGDFNSSIGMTMSYLRGID